MRALVAEIFPYHEECMPGFVAALNALGVVPDLLLNTQSIAAKGQVFDAYPGLRVGRVFAYVSGGDESALLAELNTVPYDLVLANSFQGETPRFYRRLACRTLLAVVHNQRRLAPADLRWMLALPPRRRRLVFLHDFVAANFLATHPQLRLQRTAALHAVAPVPGTPLARAATPCRISVPGGVNPRNRDYAGLATALATLDRGTAARLQLSFDGMATPAVAAELGARLAAANPAVDVRFHVGGFADYRAYYASIAASHYVLPLIPPASRYLQLAITSSVHAGLACGAVVAMDAAAVDLYGVGDPIDAHGLGAWIARAVDGGAAGHGERLARQVAAFARWQEQDRQQLQAVLAASAAAAGGIA